MKGMWGTMHTGHKVSAVLHVGLILWVMLFDLFSAPERDLRPPVTDVSLVSAAEFAALSQPRPAAPPIAPEPAPEPAPAPEPEPVAPPEPVPAPQPEPEPAPITAPEPVVPQPQPTPPPPADPQPDATSERPQAAVVSPEPSPPDASLRPIQRPAERVAPEAVPAPAPEVTIDRRDQAAAEPDATPEPAEAPPAQEETAREAAATETVTEATDISETEPVRRTATAPEVSLRPQRRPERPATPPATPPAPVETATRPTPPATPAPTPTPAPEPTGPSADAVADALAAALSESLDLSGGFDTGPSSMSQADIDGLRLRVEECWNVGLLSSDALQAVVTIGFDMTPDARPLEGTIRLVDAQGGGQAGQMAAFDAGRRAIVECGINGYGLPSELYDLWRQVEITFNPARMSIR